jgi:hypothetical protein
VDCLENMAAKLKVQSNCYLACHNHNETIKTKDPSKEEFYNVLKSGKFIDVNVTWNNAETPYKLHKSVLAAGSPYFKRFLDGEIGKLQKSKIKSTEAFEVFLVFLYTNCVRKKT